jgi:hypothetical protein
VRADHHVRTAALLGRRDEGGLLVLGDRLDLHGDAVLGAELVSERLEGGGPLVVGPDHELAGRGLRGRPLGGGLGLVAAAGGGEGEDQGGGYTRGTDAHIRLLSDRTGKVC